MSLSMDSFLNLITSTLGAEDCTLDPSIPIGEQIAADSARLIELTITLENELGADLPADVDLRAATAAQLYEHLGEPTRA